MSLEPSKPVILKPYGDIDWELQRLGDIAEIRGTPCSSESDLVAAIQNVDILSADVDVTVTARVINSANRLRAIFCTSMGTDYVDIDAANRKGIVIAYLPDFAVNAVSEQAIMLMFMTARRLNALNYYGKVERWDKRRLFKGFELEGKTLGLIGFGKTGRAVARKASGIGMTLLAYDPYATPAQADAAGATLVQLDEMLAQADVISIHAALTPETRHLIGTDQLRRMKPSSIIINVARGAIIDEDSLIQALKDGTIAGAGLDVLVDEPPDEENPLLDMHNVVITPHIAWNTSESDQRSKTTMEEEYLRLIRGEEPKNFANRQYFQSH